MNKPLESSEVGKTSYRRILGHSSIYILGMMISKVVGFIMIPIYTHYLAPADYGVLELLTMTSDIIAMLIGIGLAQSVLRFYYNYEAPEDRNSVVSTALITGILLFAGIFGVLNFQSSLAANIILGSGDSANYFNIIFITMMFFAGVEIPLVYLRAQQRSIYFVVINLIKLIIQLALNIYFIVILQWGVLGVLYSGLIATVAVGLFLTVQTFWETGFHFSINKLKELIKYGYPLIFTNIGAFVLTYSDRYFLKFYTDLNEVGIYSLGYKFGMMVSILLLGPFHQFWTAEMFAVAKRDDAKKVFRDFFTYSTFISILFCFAISIYMRDAIELISEQSYWSAYKVIPYICLAYIFMGLHGFTCCGILIAKETRFMAYSTVYAVIANVVLNFILIPKLGAVGAALATIGAFGIRFYTTFRYSQRFFPIKYEWGRIISSLSLAVIMVAAAFMVKFDNLFYNLIFDTGVLISYLLILYILGWFNSREKELIIQLIKKPSSLIRLLKLFKGNN
ncbi:MAG: oligosaccharide flippase family protein [candidate division Zixibacteria bacterium]|nr:oligosaccharide flippase family protein [candidate division Zixibacteria bacterium]